MKKLISLKDLPKYSLPADIAHSAYETLNTPDSYYGSDRTDSELGGYLLIIEHENELSQLTDIFYETINNLNPEIVDIISDSYLKSLYILNPDFTVTVIYPTETAPNIVKRFI